MELWEKAKKMGKDAHAGTTWAAGLPYDEHLERVASTVYAWTQQLPDKVREHLVAAAWLHDAVEDTGMALDTIEKELGPEVRALVWAVTDEPGANRAERHARTFPKTKNVPFATALKLADRIVNVEANLQNRGGFYTMYRKEHPIFRAALYNPTHTYLEPMWRHLDKLMMIEPSKDAVKVADKIMSVIRDDIHIPVGTSYVDVRDKIAVAIQESCFKEEKGQ